MLKKYGLIATTRNKEYAVAACVCGCAACTGGLTNQIMRLTGSPFVATATRSTNQVVINDKKE